jgi:hypothetical protein
MPNFGFQPGVLDYWMLLSDWRNGTFAILLTIAVLLIGYALLREDLGLPALVSAKTARELVSAEGSVRIVHCNQSLARRLPGWVEQRRR